MPETQTQPTRATAPTPATAGPAVAAPRPADALDGLTQPEDPLAATGRWMAGRLARLGRRLTQRLAPAQDTGPHVPSHIDVDGVWRQAKYDVVLTQMASSLDGCFGDDDTGSIYRTLRDGAPTNLLVMNATDVCRERTRRTLHLLTGSHDPTVGNNRDRYKAFVEAFRGALASTYYTDHVARGATDDPYVTILHAIARTQMTAVHAQTFLDDVTQRFVLSGGGTTTTVPDNATPIEALRSTLDQIEHQYDAVQVHGREARVQQVVGELKFVFDPYAQGNPPNVKCTLGGRDGQTVTNVRTATPTHGDEINDEFRAFLRDLGTRGERYLYVNLQDRRRNAHSRQLFGMGLSVEWNRARALENLAQEPEFQDVLHVWTLDKNSDFYHQKGDHGHASQSAMAFIDTFIAEFEDPEGGFYMPGMENHVRAILSQVHGGLFDAADTLTAAQRRDFIELAYDRILDTGMRQTGASYYSASCKDCIDRGGGANFLTKAIRTTFEAVDPQADAFREHLSSLSGDMFGDALWSRKRVIRKERLERAISAAKHFAALPAEMQQMWARTYSLPNLTQQTPECASAGRGTNPNSVATRFAVAQATRSQG